MKLNRSLLTNTALILSLLIFPSLSVQAKEGTNHAPDHGAKTTNTGLLSKRTTELEFTFALVSVVGGLIVSEGYQRKQEE